MKFCSLRDNSVTASFAEAMMQGQAPDGGLYFPVDIPRLSDAQIRGLQTMDQQSIAHMMLSLWLSDEMSPSELTDIVSQASTFPTPVKEVGNKHILELFHGPTMAFKDVGARYLAAFMSHFNKQLDTPVTILVATSGDTGGGIAQAFSGVPNTQVVVLFPKGRVSRLQYEQLTRVESNVRSLELAGSFDDCQAFVKKAFTDPDLHTLRLTSANSINVGRLLPQTTYYATSYSQLANEKLRFIVPTGNLGNLTAGVLAKRSGIPIDSFVAANNANDAVYRYLETGVYEPHASVNTLSNAMDVGSPNNLARLESLFDNDINRLREEVKAAVVTDDETLQTIQKVYTAHSYILDPHTAVAWRASEKLVEAESTDVIVATASPLKFAEEINQKLDLHVDNSSELSILAKRPSHVQSMGADYESFKSFLAEKLQ